MEEGLWTAIFSSGGPISGGGVVYLADGKLIGGDSQFYYVGTYTFDVNTQHLQAQATVIPFVSGAISIFGIEVPRYELVLSGRLQDSEASISGSVADFPNLRLNVKLVKRADGTI
jgi:hypothetical protein